MGDRSYPNGSVPFRKGRPCSICNHPSRAKIEEGIAGYVPYRRLAQLHGVSISAISRHVSAHVREELLAVLRERVAAHREREVAEELGPEFAEWMRAEEARFAEALDQIGEGLGQLELEEEGASE